MVPAIAQGGVDLARSLEALSAVLQNGQDETMRLAEKLMKVGVQQTIQDTSVGMLIDTTA
jgi:hypothetical protein